MGWVDAGFRVREDNGFSPTCIPLTSCRALGEITMTPGSLSALIYKMGMTMPSALGGTVRSARSRAVPITTVTVICSGHVNGKFDWMPRNG